MAGKKIGVIAGTPVDAAMGVEVLEAKGFEARPYPTAASAREQNEFQMIDQAVRTEKIRALLKQLMADGMQGAMIYCNSLSASIDAPALGRELGIPLVTPLDAYAEYALNYSNLGVIAANNGALAGIERSILGANPKCNAYGVCFLPAVTAIEEGQAPAAIVAEYALATVLEWFAQIKAQAVILGCTHFPYLAAELKKYAKMPLLDPADRMCELLDAQIK